MVYVKNNEEIAKMRVACQALKEVLAELKAMIKPGVTGLDLDQRAEELIYQKGCEPNFKGLYGFPNTICVSLNDVLIHGIPNDKPFQEGDLVSVDAGCMYQNYHSDAAFTVIVGQEKDPQHPHLVEVTQTALEKAIAIVKPGIRTGDIGHVIQSYVESEGFFLPEDYVGHGIGKALHEDPPVPNTGEPGRGVRLYENMTICIEPMVQMKTNKLKLLADKWTPVSIDGSMSAHFEHTILITSAGCEVLTK